ncbi:MAG: lysine--tRNA ligase [Deltaproteobacteria bacterium]|nr:MAG: lysine--tRNA ligase [Deltaproteobacteria bacterium]
MPDAPHLVHWADHAARRTLAAHPDTSPVVVAAGITPSGVVHIGNFREVITVDFVARALADQGAEVDFLYSWDDFDVFRKVPKDVPDPEALAEHLGRSIADVPDPWGCHESYAAHHVETFEASLEPLGIRPRFVRQHRMYRSGAYAAGIRRALEHAERIRTILNDARRTHGAKRLLPDDWLPLAGFCDACGRDDLVFSWDGGDRVTARCNRCGHTSTTHLPDGGNLKLPWRVDWPMRWAHERVCFEPGGKDHSSAGGSYDTARRIVAEVYDWTAPEYVGYDFVRIKGEAGKISSSRGGVVTVADCLEIYEPEVLRWIFASYRPNTEFQISFDLDVLKLYEDYDRAVRLAHEAEDGSRSDKKRRMARRTLQLSRVDHRPVEPGTSPPYLPAFRPLSVALQIFDGDVEAALDFYRRAEDLPPDDPAAAERFRSRARCIWNWIERFAPDDFRYRLRTEPVARDLEPAHREALARIVAFLRDTPRPTEAEAADALRGIVTNVPGGGRAFYPVVYDLLLGRDRGPKLSTLLAAAGGKRIVPLLAPSLGE